MLFDYALVNQVSIPKNCLVGQVLVHTSAERAGPEIEWDADNLLTTRPADEMRSLDYFPIYSLNCRICLYDALVDFLIITAAKPPPSPKV